MRCISVRQRWASEIISGRKKAERRSWPPPAGLVGQQLAIHASKLDAQARAALVRRQLPLIGGAVVGHVLLRGVRRDPRYGWAWLLSKPVALAQPVRLTGKLGLWHWG